MSDFLADPDTLAKLTGYSDPFGETGVSDDTGLDSSLDPMLAWSPKTRPTVTVPTLATYVRRHALELGLVAELPGGALVRLMAAPPNADLPAGDGAGWYASESWATIAAERQRRPVWDYSAHVPQAKAPAGSLTTFLAAEAAQTPKALITEAASMVGGARTALERLEAAAFTAFYFGRDFDSAATTLRDLGRQRPGLGPISAADLRDWVGRYGSAVARLRSDWLADQVLVCHKLTAPGEIEDQFGRRHPKEEDKRHALPATIERHKRHYLLANQNFGTWEVQLFPTCGPSGDYSDRGPWAYTTRSERGRWALPGGPDEVTAKPVTKRGASEFESFDGYYVGESLLFTKPGRPPGSKTRPPRAEPLIVVERERNRVRWFAEIGHNATVIAAWFRGYLDFYRSILRPGPTKYRAGRDDLAIRVWELRTMGAEVEAIASVLNCGIRTIHNLRQKGRELVVAAPERSHFEKRAHGNPAKDGRGQTVALQPRAPGPLLPETGNAPAAVAPLFGMNLKRLPETTASTKEAA